MIMKELRSQMKRAYNRKDWRRYFGLAWCGGLVATKEAERLYHLKYIIARPEGNYYVQL